MKKATLMIKGMHCAACGANVEKELSKIGGVSNVRVNVLLGKAYADCEDSVKKDQLSAAVKKVGFSPLNIDLK